MDAFERSDQRRRRRRRLQLPTIKSRFHLAPRELIETFTLEKDPFTNCARLCAIVRRAGHYLQCPLVTHLLARSIA